MQFNAVVEANTAAVKLSRSLGVEVLATVPEPFEHSREGYVGLHIVYRQRLIGPRFGRRFAWEPFIPVSSPPISLAPRDSQARHPASEPTRKEWCA